jgi:histidine triad (HIT) family protein
MNDCIFCKIINKEIPSETVYEDEWVVAFKDIHPVAPIHILIVPKKHIISAAEIDESNATLVSKVFIAARLISEQLNLSNGFRIVTNTGEDGGQTVKHIHFHLLGGKKLSPNM